MPNYIPKKLRIVQRATGHVDSIVNGIVGLRECAWDIAQTDGALIQTDFDGSDMQHINADTFNLLLSLGIQRLAEVAMTPIDSEDPNSPTLDDVMRHVKR